MDTSLSSQHQSSHQNDTPWFVIGCCSAKFASASPTLLQSKTAHGPLLQLLAARSPPAMAWACAYCGSFVAMLE